LEHVPTSFVAGTRVLAQHGAIPIEQLRSGDMVLGPGGRPQRVRSVGLVALSAAVLDERPAARPVRVRAGALGPGLPERDLLLAPRTTVLIPGSGIGAPAWTLVNGCSVTREPGGGVVHYHQVERETSMPLVVEGVLADVASNDGLTSQMLRARGQIVRAAGLASGVLEGSIDRCDHSGISGWARDVDFPGFAVALEVEVDGTSVACIMADQDRTDLIAAGKGACAFRMVFDPPLRADRGHMICIRRADNRAPMPRGDVLLDGAPGLEFALAALDDTHVRALREIIGRFS
jgi:hypothetical protein